MKNKKQNKGVIIIEVLVAAFIFATALLALLEFQTTLMQNRGLLSQEAEAFELAQDKMDSLRNYTVLNTTAGQFAYADIVNGTSAFAGVTANFTITWTVTNFPDTSGTATAADAIDFDARKNVRVVVAWTDQSGVAHTSTTPGAANSAVYIDSTIARIDPAGTGKVSQNLP